MTRFGARPPGSRRPSGVTCPSPGRGGADGAPSARGCPSPGAVVLPAPLRQGGAPQGRCPRGGTCPAGVRALCGAEPASPCSAGALAHCSHGGARPAGARATAHRPVVRGGPNSPFGPVATCSLSTAGRAVPRAPGVVRSVRPRRSWWAARAVPRAPGVRALCGSERVGPCPATMAAHRSCEGWCPAGARGTARPATAVVSRSDGGPYPEGGTLHRAVGRGPQKQPRRGGGTA